VTFIAKRYLFIEPKQRAYIYLAVVVVLSLFADYMPLPNHYYFVQKRNMFNQYGPKIGWFWTTLLLSPFIYLTSMVHHQQSVGKAVRDLTRLAVATGSWLFWTKMWVCASFRF